MKQDFSLAWAKNPRQVLYKTFSMDEDGESKSQVFDWEELASRSVQALLLPEKARLDGDLQARVRQFPLPRMESEGMGEEAFENLDYQGGRRHLERALGQWTLQNNLNLLENLFAHLEHLNALFASDRSAFFEELWQLTKNNLGARELKIVYRHLISRGENGGKAKMCPVIVEGEHTPNSVEKRQLGEALLENCTAASGASFQVLQYSPQSGEWLATVSLAGSPVLLMARVFHFSALQRALFKALFAGLSHKISREWE